MGRKFSIVLGFLLVFSLGRSIECSSLHRNFRLKRDVELPTIQKPSTETSTNTADQTTQISETTYKNNLNETSSIQPDDKENLKDIDEVQINNSSLADDIDIKNTSGKETGRSLNIDIDKYVSPEFHSKNNVYTFPTSPEIQKYTDPEIHQFSDRIDKSSENFEKSSVSPLDLLGLKYRSVAESIKQNLEEHEASLKPLEETEEKENKYEVSKLIDKVNNKDNETDAHLHVVETKTIEQSTENNKNHKNGDLTVENTKTVDYNENYYKTKTYNEKQPSVTPVSDIKNNKPTEQTLESSAKKVIIEKPTTEITNLSSTTKKTRGKYTTENNSGSTTKDTVKSKALKQFSVESSSVESVHDVYTPATDNSINMSKRGPIKYNSGLKSTTPTNKEIDFDGKGFSIPPSATAWSLATLKKVPELKKVTTPIHNSTSPQNINDLTINSTETTKLFDSKVEENVLVKNTLPPPKENATERIDLNTDDAFSYITTTIFTSNTDIITTDAPPKTTPTMFWTTLWEEMQRVINETELPGISTISTPSNEKSIPIITKPSKTQKHENEIMKTSEEVVADIKNNSEGKVQNTSEINITTENTTSKLETTTTLPLNESSTSTENQQRTTIEENSTESTTPLSDIIIDYSENNTESINEANLEATKYHSTDISTEEENITTTENIVSTLGDNNTSLNLTSRPDMKIVSVTESPLLDEPVTNITSEEPNISVSTVENDISEIVTVNLKPTLNDTTISEEISTPEPLEDFFDKTSSTTSQVPIDIIEHDHEERPKENHNDAGGPLKPKVQFPTNYNSEEDSGNKIPNEVNTRTTITVEISTKPTVVPHVVNSTTVDPTNGSEIISHDNDEKDKSNPGMIAAIVISSVAAICLVILAGLLVVMKKRQKRVTYGQRCRPVSLDAYSLDNVSVYNSVRRKGDARASKRSYGNPAFDDPDSISHPMNFQVLVKFNDNQEGISAEYEQIPQVTARAGELPPGCETKNRYANIIPLPETRVYLKTSDNDPNSDYINANYVTGSKNTRGYYIACQAPMDNTIDDFWRMIWEQNSKVILMLTNLFENGVEKCSDYLPPSEVLDCHRLFGDYQITLKKRDVKEKYIISSLQLKNMVSNSWREVTHLWYIGWPERGVPQEVSSIIAFLIEARSHLRSTLNNNNTEKESGSPHRRLGVSPDNSGPVVVHCSPGTGRTGTAIACDVAIREFELTRHVDIPRIVYRIRRDRANAVQTRDQYAFIYKVITLYSTKLTGGALDSI